MTEYELWSFGRTWDKPESGWIFHGYKRLNLSDVIRYNDFGYYVRKVTGDRSSTIPLFPILAAAEPYPGSGLD